MAASTGASAAGSHNEPTIRLKRIGTSYTPVYTDGVRWAVYEPTEGVTRVMDTITGTSTTRPDPDGCAGGLIAVGGGEILYACSDHECPEATDACVISPVQTIGQPYQRSYEIGRWIVEDVTSGAEQQLNAGKGLPPYGRAAHIAYGARRPCRSARRRTQGGGVMSKITTRVPAEIARLLREALYAQLGRAFEDAPGGPQERTREGWAPLLTRVAGYARRSTRSAGPRLSRSP